MTRRTNARIAGIMFLLYIVVGVAGIILFNPVESADGTAAKLASIAEHAVRVRLAVLQYMAFVVFSLVLAATLYAITRDEDPDIALIALSCRVVEGMLNGLGVFAMAGTLVARSRKLCGCLRARGGKRTRCHVIQISRLALHYGGLDLLRGHHAILLPLPARPKYSGVAGLAGCCRLGLTCRVSAHAVNRNPQRSCHRLHLGTDGGV